MSPNPLPFDDLKARGTAIVVVRKPLAEIAAEVCARRGNVYVWEIFGRDRSHRVSHARQEVVWHARQLGYSLHMIGRRFPRPENVEGCLDHSTVLFAERRHEERIRAATMRAVREADHEAAAGYRAYLAGVRIEAMRMGPLFVAAEP